MTNKTIKERAKKAEKSIMQLAQESGVKYQSLYLAARGLANLSPDNNDKVETTLKAWGV